jgi:hypothetical protein
VLHAWIVGGRESLVYGKKLTNPINPQPIATCNDQKKKKLTNSEEKNITNPISAHATMAKK